MAERDKSAYMQSLLLLAQYCKDLTPFQRESIAWAHAEIKRADLLKLELQKVMNGYGQ